MGPSSDQIEREIAERRGSMESKIVALRERSRRQVRRASRTALVVAGAGAAVGLAVVGAIVIYRLTRPATPGERVRRLLPAGLAGLTEALAVEGRPLGIRANAVSPGSVATPMLALSGAPREPALRPEDVARVVAWLASEESAPLSGANLRLDPS